MSVIRIAGRYAKSLIDLAVEQKKLEQVKSDIDLLNQAFKNRDLQLLLKSPIVHGSKKQSIIKAIFEQKVDKLTSSFFNILVSKGRESYLPEIAQSFLDQYRQLKNISVVKLITAVPMDEKTLEALRQKLVSSTSTQNNIELVTVVKPGILGGFQLEFDNKLYDASIQHRLEELRKTIEKRQFVTAF